MVINKFKMKLLKAYYSIKGFLKTHLTNNKMFKIEDFSGNFKNIIYTRIKGNEFLIKMEGMEPSTGVIYFDTRKEKVPYWTLGILNLTKINKSDFSTGINKEEII